MSVYKTPKSTNWQYDFQYRGRRFHGSTGKKAKRVAERVEAQMRAEAALNVKRKKPITLDEAAGLYEQKLRKEERWSKSTETWLDSFVNAIGHNTFLADIDHVDIGTYFRKRTALVEG